MGRAATWMEEGEDIGLKGGNDQSYRGGILMLGAAGPWKAWRGLVLLPGGVQRCWSNTCACVHVPVNQGLRGPGVHVHPLQFREMGRYSLGQWASERDTLGIPWSSSG